MERSCFFSDSSQCVGYWHWPSKTDVDGRFPVILMGHGFGTEWRFGTLSTINDFTMAGIAVFTFDYRYFGESAGTPRQLLSVKHQLVDWQNALKHVRKEQRVDDQRLTLWGSSLGGGHALSIAAQDHGIAAVIAQVPHCNAAASIKNIKPITMVRLTAHALWDSVLAWFGRVHTIPILGNPDELAAMTFAGWKSEGLQLVPSESHWVNAMPARSMFSAINYYPDKTAHQIRCPVCIHYGLKDRGVPPQSVEKTAAKITQVELHAFEGDHFDVYHNPLRAKIVAEQLDFLRRFLFL